MTERPSPIEVFCARAEARAILYHAGELDLHSAVDGLQELAEQFGLVDYLGQDQVQAILAEIFSLDGLPLPIDDEYSDVDLCLPELDGDCCPTCGAAPCVNPSFCAVNRESDARRGPPKPYAPTPRPVLAASTIQAFEHLVRERDVSRLRAWLARRNDAERRELLHLFHFGVAA